MNDSYPDRTAQAAQPYLLLADELRRLGQRLDGIGDELLQLTGLGWPHPSPVPGGHVPAGPMPSGPMPIGPVAGGRDLGGPPPGPGYPPAAGYPAPPPPRRTAPPLFRPVTALSGARLMAWTGGAVTLLGVVLLLVLAASRGWFSPPARVGAGVALGVVLVGLGCWLHRRESARTGAVALAATGFATGYLVLAAATAIYGYLTPVPALLLALLVAGGGLGLADRWRSQPLAGGVVVAAALLAPVLAGGWLLVALLLALQAAALPVLLRRRWPVLMLLAAVGPVLAGAVGAAADEAGIDIPWIAAVLGVLVVGLGTAALTARTLPVRAVAVLAAVAPLPVFVAGVVLDGWAGAALCGVAALLEALLAVWARADRGIPLVAATVAAVALFQGTAIAVAGTTATAVVLGQAFVAAVLAATWRSRFGLLVGLAYGLFGVGRAAAVDAPLAALVEFPPYPYIEPGLSHALLTGAGISVLVTALAVVLLFAGGRVGWVRPEVRSAGLWVPIGLVGLYGTTSLVVTLALLAAPDRVGFTAGHALVTVSWTVLALLLLARGIRRPALRVTGLVLVAAAVAKLVLFDLVALDGMARVAAFLGAGLVLLAAGTRYARMVAEATPGPDR
ncbi:MAG TPA: DUF2339 domain-containing protein [Pseudonocardia sp.]|nr:DUF2339 domain-containing protein [Pseudonocardia sp.]